MRDFQLHPRLAEDTFEVIRWPLCRVLLMNDSRFPWLILVPARDGLREIHDLEASDQMQFLRESIGLGRFLLEHFQGFKLNVAALGNVVPQLHVHHIVRYPDDPCWPRPVWGQGIALAYGCDAAEALVSTLRARLAAVFPVAAAGMVHAATV